jgi:hypothetical protein
MELTAFLEQTGRTVAMAPMHTAIGKPHASTAAGAPTAVSAEAAWMRRRGMMAMMRIRPAFSLAN